MTNLISLTIADTNGTKGIAGQEVYVNPAQITHFYVYPAINATVVILSGEDLWIHVNESPDTIYDKIWNAEHPECRL